MTPAEQEELDHLVNAQADDLDWLAKVDRQYPLATSVLWTSDKVEGCDQRRALAAMMRAPSIGVILGGVRSGKSKLCKDWTLASALGGNHPVTRAWLELNDLPLDSIPDGPAEMYVIAGKSGDSVRYHRPDFAELVGQLPHSWSNENSKGEATLRLHVPGYRKAGKLHFMSVAGGAPSMQGISLRGAWVDEEPLGAEGRKVMKHLSDRVVDKDGRIVVSMRPAEGLTWFHDYYVRDRKDDVVIVELDSLDNPHLPHDRMVRHFDGMDEDEFAQRQLGRFRALTGAVYKLDSGDGTRWGAGHLCDPFTIPPDWLRFRGIDYGLVNPTCVLWGALGDDDTLYIYREYYRANGDSYEWHADQVAPMEGLVRKSERDPWKRGDHTESIECGWGDPAAREARITFNDAGLETLPARNDVKGGIDRIKDRLRLRGDGRPRLKIFRTCPNLWREMNGYVWDPNRKDEVPKKEDDHSCDALKYLVQGIHSSR